MQAPGDAASGGRETAHGPGAATDSVHIFWIAGMSCDGCTIAFTGASSPSIEQLLRGSVPGLPRVVLHHPFFAQESGRTFLDAYRKAARGELDAPYLVVVEGSATDDLRAGEGYWSAMGSGDTNDADGNVVDGVPQPLRSMDWIRALAPDAVACVALGTCAAWGGVPGALGNPMGAGSLSDLLGSDYRSALGMPVISIPGCAPGGDNIVETLAALLLFLRGVGPAPELDDLGRPAWLFEETVHRRCVRAGFYEEGVFARTAGEVGCLVELGCWGAVVQCNITSRGAIGGLGGCMNVGGACNGCTMPGFPDSFSNAAEAVSPAAIAADWPAERLRTPGGLRSLPVVPTPAGPVRLDHIEALPVARVWTFAAARTGRRARHFGAGDPTVWRFWQARGKHDDPVAMDEEVSGTTASRAVDGRTGRGR